MAEDKVLLDFPKAFDVVDIEHPERLDWRRCAFRVVALANGRVSLCVTVRQKKDGRPTQDLFEGAFGAALESIARRVLCTVPGLEEPHELRTGFLHRGGSRGYSKGTGSALLHYNLPDHMAQALLQLNAHSTLKVLDTARNVAQIQARIRAAAAG